MVLQDRYRILRKLGSGGMGAVYEGEHILIKRRVAIKVLHQQFAQNPEISARFHREAEAATAIGHPNIVEVTDMGHFPDGTAYMVLEFLKGRDWAKDITTEGPQPLGKVVHIMAQVCDALGAAHAKGIVHRDLKPENIFLIERPGDRNFVKILDFGISKIADASAVDRSLTQTGTALGTPYYMAPEQCHGKKDVDHRADIYSLGVILFQALTRQYPFDDESYPMLVLKICTEPPPPLAQYRPDLPPAVIEIVNRMLAKHRDHRFASCDEVRAALEPFRHVHDAPVIVADAPSTASRGPSVLQQVAAAPVMAPSGTHYPGSSPALTAEPQQGEQSSSRGLIAIIALLCVLVLAGGTVGAVAAFTGVLSPRRGSADRAVAQRADDGREGPASGGTETTPPADTARSGQANDRASGGTETTPPADTAQSGQVSERAPEQVAAAGATDSSPTPPPEGQPAPEARETVHVHVEVEGPASALVTIDNVQYGSAPVDVDLPRDPSPEPGGQPRLHVIEVQAEGYETVRHQVPFTGDVTRTISMPRRVAGHRTRNTPTIQSTGYPRSTPTSVGTNPPPDIIRPRGLERNPRMDLQRPPGF